ncbi:hypothetical protein [Phytohabitans suffuscus]
MRDLRRLTPQIQPSLPQWRSSASSARASHRPPQPRRSRRHRGRSRLRAPALPHHLDQNIPFDKNLDVFFAWVAKYDSVYHVGTSANVVKARYYDTLRKLRKAPAAGKIGPTEWAEIFSLTDGNVFVWKGVAAAFSAWVNERDAEPLLAGYRQPGRAGADNGYAIYLGVQCTDAQWPTNWSTATGALPQRQPGNRSDKQCEPLPQPIPTPTATATTRTTPDITRADLLASWRPRWRPPR